MGEPFSCCRTATCRRPIWPFRIGLLIVATSILPTAVPAADSPAKDAPASIRVTWGGGKPTVWRGTISLADGPEAAASDGLPPGGNPFGRLRSLSTEPDANASVHISGGRILVHPPSARGFDGVEFEVTRWTDARLVIDLAAESRGSQRSRLEIPVADLLSSPQQHSLDQEGNRLQARRSPGDALRVVFDDGKSAMRRPGDIVRMAVHASLDDRAAGTSDYELRMQLVSAGKTIVSRHFPLVATSAAGSDLRVFEPIPVEVALPTKEGVFDVELQVFDRGLRRWSRAIASRTVQLVGVASLANAAPDTELTVVCEVDPGSPRLLERLRRMPGMAVPSLPRMTVPGAEGVKLPSLGLGDQAGRSAVRGLESLLPRGGGLLSAGSSSLDTHPLGPVLKLPAAAAVGEPSWEGIAIPVDRTGVPHVVEVEYPTDQDAVVGLGILEPSAAGGLLPVRCEGGFCVRALPLGGEQPRMGVHRFVFWPRTKSPVVVLANPSMVRPALIGRVKVLAGPDRLAAGQTGQGPVHRGVYGYLPKPDLARFGAGEGIEEASGRTVHGWADFLAGVSGCAELLKAQGADGAMVAAYADGAALWPSRQGLQSPRWDGGVFAEKAPDPVPKNILGLVARVFERESLGLVAAIECAGPLTPLEAMLASPAVDGTGIECVGRDGHPPAADRQRGRRRYNILDPRVQATVAALVDELAVELATTPSARGLALLIGHDGWMHMPGVAWGLDDATMARFGKESGIAIPGGGPERFAARATLVEGPAKEAWLEWRTGEIAKFHARLAGVVARRAPTIDLYPVVTTLFSEGPLAARFRPMLAAEPADTDILREIGIDPSKIASNPKVVFVSPHLHGAGDDLVAESTMDGANRSLAVLRGLVRVPRRGGVAIERPVRLDLRQVVRQVAGPSAAASGGVAAWTDMHAVAAGPDRLRPLAESLIASDIEVVFDQSLLLGLAPKDTLDAFREFSSLPRQPMATAANLPAPLVVRSVDTGQETWMCLVNASRAPCTARLAVEGGPIEAPLTAWGLKVVKLKRAASVAKVVVVHEPAVKESIVRELASLRRRRSSLEMPAPLAVLDNPGFELAEASGTIPGWELVEAARGSIEIVPSSGSGGSQAIRFASEHGLSTLQSNPFPPPRTGRVSVAAWLRLEEAGPQPPLRIAVEGREGDRQFYRFAPVGLGTGSMPLKSEWSQVVLQIDDLPSEGLDLLRVRFDLLGPGRVQIDDVRVFDLAFDESQRVQLSKVLAMVDHHVASGDVGAGVVELDGHWPRFLHEFVAEKPAEEPAKVATEAEEKAGASKRYEIRSSVIERMRRWWQ